MNNLILFDLDGVITSEDAYWTTAGLVVHELLYSPHYWNVNNQQSPYHPPADVQESRRLSYEILPEGVIIGFKARSINSNWDTCYTAVCLRLIELLAHVPDLTALLPLRPAEEDWIAAFRGQLAQVPTLRRQSISDKIVYSHVDDPVFEGYSGLDFIKRFDAYASKRLGQHIEGVFARYSPSWVFCQDLFQEWYLGEALYTQEYSHSPKQTGKIGCIHFEQPLLPKEQIQATLEALCEQGYILGVVTGRPGQEALVPLQNYGFLRYFDKSHVTTHAEVARAEDALRARGHVVSLVKPHSYQFSFAANPEYNLGDALPQQGSFIVVGDTTSDIIGGRAAGALTIAVLTGARTPQARALLEQSEPDFLIEDMTKLPELLIYIDSLVTIQHLQFTNLKKAEMLLQRWFVRHMHLHTDSVTLKPKAVSLNSFNGFYRAGDEEYFFKTHVEEQGILEEYYNAELLYKVGYNIVRPIRTLHEQGQQMVLYPVIHWPVMFDLMRAVEKDDTGQTTLEQLVEAEKRECTRLLSIYKNVLASSSAEQNAKAPIHQLFWHRLAGERFKSFYEGKQVFRPDATGESIPFEHVLTYRWKINGELQHSTLGELIERAKRVLRPARDLKTVIGHGDAHFGNVFLEDQRDYLYFDPAFGGHHSPLLDVIKPLFHNIFATWMYFPHEIAQEFHITLQVDDEKKLFSVDHTFTLSPIRQAMLQTKMEYLITPLLGWLRSIDALPDDWLEILQSALLCCPLLTINLLDRERVPNTITWLGLLLTVYMGNNGVVAWR